eukprot:RCo028929
MLLISVVMLAVGGIVAGGGGNRAASRPTDEHHAVSRLELQEQLTGMAKTIQVLQSRLLEEYVAAPGGQHLLIPTVTDGKPYGTSEGGTLRPPPTTVPLEAYFTMRIPTDLVRSGSRFLRFRIAVYHGNGPDSELDFTAVLYQAPGGVFRPRDDPNVAQRCSTVVEHESFSAYGNTRHYEVTLPWQEEELAGSVPTVVLWLHLTSLTGSYGAAVRRKADSRPGGGLPPLQNNKIQVFFIGGLAPPVMG